MQVPEHVKEALKREGKEGASENLRFPISVSDARAEQDHQGVPCTTYDCAFHTYVLAAARMHRYWLCQDGGSAAHTETHNYKSHCCVRIVGLAQFQGVHQMAEPYCCAAGASNVSLLSWPWVTLLKSTA